MNKPTDFRVPLAAMSLLVFLSGCGRTVPNQDYLQELNAGRDAYLSGNWAAADEKFVRAKERADRAPITPETFGTSVTLKGVRVAAPALSQSIDVWTVALGPEHPTVLTGLMQWRTSII